MKLKTHTRKSTYQHNHDVAKYAIAMLEPVKKSLLQLSKEVALSRESWWSASLLNKKRYEACRLRI